MYIYSVYIYIYIHYFVCVCIYYYVYVFVCVPYNIYICITLCVWVCGCVCVCVIEEVDGGEKKRVTQIETGLLHLRSLYLPKNYSSTKTDLKGWKCQRKIKRNS